MTNISVVVADDHPFLLRGVSDFLTCATNIRVIGTCADGPRALSAIREKRPIVAILGTSLPKMSGFDILMATQQEDLPTRTILLAATAEARDIVAAMAEGAHGYLLKDSRPDELLRCVYDVAAGRKCLPFELLERSREKDGNKANHVPIQNLLTPREWKVMALAAEGLSNKEIAQRLKVATGTTKVHLNHIYRKIGVRNRTSLANLAVRYAPGSGPAGDGIAAGLGKKIHTGN